MDFMSGRMIKWIVGAFFCVSSGFMVSGGLFTAMIVLGLAPRFAARTHTAGRIFYYENYIEAGSIIGCILSVSGWGLPKSFINLLSFYGVPMQVLSLTGIGFFGIFSGLFVGCVSLALAEFLDTFSVFGRRIQLKKGLSFIIFAMAIGKTIGSLLYYFMNLGINAE